MELLIVALVLYFLPTVVASCRAHHNAGAIFALNLLLGWTFLGWVLALVWACTAVKKPEPVKPSGLVGFIEARKDAKLQRALLEEEAYRRSQWNRLRSEKPNEPLSKAVSFPNAIVEPKGLGLGATVGIGVVGCLVVFAGTFLGVNYLLRTEPPDGFRRSLSSPETQEPYEVRNSHGSSGVQEVYHQPDRINVSRQNENIATLLPAEASDRHETQMWVIREAANRRTCPSTACGAVGKLLYRESAKVLDAKNGWGRVSKYYDAACVGGRSEYVDSGAAQCVPENGIVNGQFAEWVRLDLLSEQRPADPGVSATVTAKLVAQSDDFLRHEGKFVKAAEALMASGECTTKDISDNGGFMRSTNKGEGVYFIYCGGGSDRIYLDVASGRTFR